MKKLLQALKNINFNQIKTTGLAGVIAAITWYGDMIQTNLQEIRKDQIEELQRMDDLEDRVEELEKVVL